MEVLKDISIVYERSYENNMLAWKRKGTSVPFYNFVMMRLRMALLVQS